jgi:hypothetical protein
MKMAFFCGGRDQIYAYCIIHKRSVIILVCSLNAAEEIENKMIERMATVGVLSVSCEKANEVNLR